MDISAYTVPYADEFCLYILESVSYDHTTSICIDLRDGTPFEKYNHCIIRGHYIGSEISYRKISFDAVKDLAKSVSDATYETFKDINETNWKSYIDQEKIELRKRFIARSSR